MFAERLENLLKEQKIGKMKMLSDLSLGKNQFNYWKKTGTIPNGFTVELIASYLGTTVDYLLGKTDVKDPEPPTDLSEDEKELLGLLQQLNEDDLKTMLKIAIAMAENNKENK